MQTGNKGLVWHFCTWQKRFEVTFYLPLWLALALLAVLAAEIAFAQLY